jgi:hypothetical protein
MMRHPRISRPREVNGLLRQVVYEGLREDKPATEVQRPVPHPKVAPADSRTAASKKRRARRS